MSPNSVMFTDIASPTVPCDHPNSWCSGFIITPGTDRKPAAPRMAMKLTDATTQAQWTRVGVVLGAVTRTRWRSRFENASGMNDTNRQEHANIETCTPRM